IPGDSSVVADSVSRNPSWELADKVSSISLQVLSLQLVDRKDVLDEEDDSLIALYESKRTSIHEQYRSLYTTDMYFDAIFKTSSESGGSYVKHSAHFTIADGFLYFRANTKQI
ncbi:unnamed protein product, partial [Aphanomyces euteiches]